MNRMFPFRVLNSAPYIYIYIFNILPNKCILLHKICNVSGISSLLQMLPYSHATILCGTFTMIVNNISLDALVEHLRLVILLLQNYMLKYIYCQGSFV